MEQTQSMILVPSGMRCLSFIKTVLNLNGIKCAIDLQTLLIPFLLYAVFYFMSDRAWPKWLTSCTFPIFLMHWLFLIYFTAISKRLQINGLIIDVVGLLIGVIGSVCAEVLISEVMAKNSTEAVTQRGGKELDWIELANTGDEDVDVSGGTFRRIGGRPRRNGT